MSGLVGGRLVQEGRCILLRTSSGDQYLPIWPPTYVLISADPPVIAGFGPGEPPLRIGEEVVLGGGGGAAEVFSSIDPPEECMPNDLWIVADVT